MQNNNSRMRKLSLRFFLFLFSEEAKKCGPLKILPAPFWQDSP